MIRSRYVTVGVIVATLCCCSIPVYARSKTENQITKIEQDSKQDKFKLGEFYSDSNSENETYFVSDIAAITSYNNKTDNGKKSKPMDTKTTAKDCRVSENKWLKSYGINPSNLSSGRLDMLHEAHNWLGSWYLYGGTTPPRINNGVWESPNTGRGFDCSSYVRYVIKKTKGFDIGRTTYDQPSSSHLHFVGLGNAKPGDLFYSNVYDHVGIYLGNNGDGTITLLHDSHTGDKVKISKFPASGRVYEVR